MNEQALKDRLKVVAGERGITFNETFKQLMLERFLARLSKSAHHDKLIFKGGLLLAQYLKIGRETTDVDFLMRKIKSEAPVIEKILQEIIAVSIDDGIGFSWDSIDELKQPHMEYSGFRVSLKVVIGKMRDKIHLDLGVGDAVNPVEEEYKPFLYRGRPIFEGEISLLVYPIESILAEKLETIVSKGAGNSRMKDYHDVLLITRERDLLEAGKLKSAVVATFVNRGTTLPKEISFDAAGVSALQALWANHLKNVDDFEDELSLPTEMSDVLSEISDWMKKSL